MVKISRGVVVGIGKVKIPKTLEMNHEIQLLSFLDIQEAENSYISTCIHLRIDGYGKTVEEAEIDMVENIYYFLRQNFEKLEPEAAWENILDLFSTDDWSNELWNAYHKVQIILSMQGKTTDNIASVMKKLEQLAVRIKELEDKIKTAEMEQIRVVLANEIRKFAKDLIVDRTTINYKVA